MELPHSDLFLEHDGENQAQSSNETNFNQHKLVEESAGLAGEGVDSRLAESSNRMNLQVAQSPSFPPRKVHSAAPTSSGFSHDDTFENIPCLYTAAAADALPSSGSPATRHRKKKTSVVPKKTARDGETPREERPRSADVNGWGDFDTDRLLSDDFEHRSNQTSIDPLDGRSRSRKSRRPTPATPATHSPHTNPWEGYLTFNNESKESSRPPMQVLRQKSIEILSLDPVAQANQSSGKAVTTPKHLLGRTSFERLTSSRSRSATGYASQPATPPPLFGTEISDTPKTRAVILNRFTNLWFLVSHRSETSLAGQPSELEPFDAVASSTDDQTRSSFECSMAMVKMCKTVGISLTPSTATHLSFWHTNEQGVDFESFCEVVILGAVQPALHHFNLDNSIDEYVSALDTIVQSLVTTEPDRLRKDKTASADYPRRLKELNEIQPVFVSWKAGITPRLVHREEDPSPTTTTRALVTAERVRKVLDASMSQRMLAHQLPSEEARVTHVENIRRKVQLHKSWKLSNDGKMVERGVSSPIARSSLISSHEKRISTSKAADLAEMLDRAHTVFPTNVGVGSGDVFPQYEGDHLEHPTDHSTTGEADPENRDGEESEEVLVCCSCSVCIAVLWCSSCFTVNCQKCWQEIHYCTVDMSMVSLESTKPLLGPTALAMKQKRSDSAPLRPSIAMIYLPTKAMVSGTLARGKPVVRLSNVVRKSSNQVTSSASKDEIPAVVANAILPSLHKSRSDTTILRHHERPVHMENSTHSTAALVKSLMLGMSPTPGSRSTGSMETTMRLHKYHTPGRPKLHLAPVSLDAELLLSTTPDRRR